MTNLLLLLVVVLLILILASLNKILREGIRRDESFRAELKGYLLDMYAEMINGKK